MTQRAIVKYRQLKKIFPVFFGKICDKCKNEFRREHGFRAFVIPPQLLFIEVARYLCQSCAPTRQDAHDYFNSALWVARRPICPPPYKKAKKIKVLEFIYPARSSNGDCFISGEMNGAVDIEIETFIDQTTDKGNRFESDKDDFNYEYQPGFELVDIKYSNFVKEGATYSAALVIYKVDK